MFFYLPNFLLALLLSFWLGAIDNVFSSTLLVILLFLYITWFRFSYIFLGFLLALDLIQRLYIGYAGKEIVASDVYLFFSHLEDVTESGALVWASLQKSLPGLVAVMVAMGMLVPFRRVQYVTQKKRWTFFILAAVFIGYFTQGGRLLVEGGKAGFRGFVPHAKGIKKAVPTVPCRKSESERDVIVIFGESMRYDPSYFKGLGTEVHPLFSGAVNTDTSLPLFFNGERRVIDLVRNSRRNLFYLAKQNGFETAFVSVQSARNLKYIRPYLYPEMIDYLKTYERSEIREKYDLLLADELHPLGDKEKSFIVMQMIGEHSPYTFYPETYASRSIQKDVAGRVREDYENSVGFSLHVIERIVAEIKTRSARPFTIVFTSDHGQLLDSPFGHNQFKKDVYTVPFFIVESENSRIEKIVTHHDLYRLVRERLGWKCEESGTQNGILIGGTMLSGEDGYLEIIPGEKSEPTGKHRWY